MAESADQAVYQADKDEWERDCNCKQESLFPRGKVMLVAIDNKD